MLNKENIPLLVAEIKDELLKLEILSQKIAAQVNRTNEEFLILSNGNLKRSIKSNPLPPYLIFLPKILDRSLSHLRQDHPWPLCRSKILSRHHNTLHSE